MVGGGKAAMRSSDKPTMAVIRGVRTSEALFYDRFENIKVKFIYLTPKPRDYPFKAQKLDFVNLQLIPRYIVDPVKMFGGSYTHRSWAKIAGLEDQLNTVDIINISDSLYAWSGDAANIAKKYNKKLVTVVWETIPDHPAVYIPPYSFNVKSVIANTDLFILRSQTARKFLHRFNINKSKVKVIYKGVDTSLFYPATEKVGKNVKILYVGQLTSSKGVEDLLEVFSDLVEGIGYMELIIAGSGPLSDKITKLAQKYPISYRGFVDYRALPKLYREADIFCSPSKYISFLGLKIWEEFFSYTLMEAMASGLPIIATYSGGIPEELGENNLLVDPGDKIQLSAALSKLVTDGKLRRKLGSLNRKRAEKFFDLAKQSRQTEEAILSLL